MKQQEQIKGADAVGVRISIAKLPDKFSRQVLFPKKLTTENEFISKLKTH
jgi:hypothetical protein